MEEKGLCEAGLGERCSQGKPINCETNGTGGSFSLGMGGLGCGEMCTHHTGRSLSHKEFHTSSVLKDDWLVGWVEILGSGNSTVKAWKVCSRHCKYSVWLGGKLFNNTHGVLHSQHGWTCQNNLIYSLEILKHTHTGNRRQGGYENWKERNHQHLEHHTKGFIQCFTDCPQSSQLATTGQNLEQWQYQMLARMWSKGNSHTSLVGTQNGIAPLE